MLKKIFTLIKTGGSFQCIISLLYFPQTNMQKQGRSWWFNFCNFDYQNIYAKSSERIRILRLNWQKFDKEGKAFLREIYHHPSSSFAFSPSCHFTGQCRKIATTIPLILWKYDERNCFSSETFLPYNNSNWHAISKLKRIEINFFQGLVTENIKDPGTTTTLGMGIPCRQQNWRGYQHIYVHCDFFSSKNLSLTLSCL